MSDASWAADDVIYWVPPQDHDWYKAKSQAKSGNEIAQGILKTGYDLSDRDIGLLVDDMVQNIRSAKHYNMIKDSAPQSSELKRLRAPQKTKWLADSACPRLRNAGIPKEFHEAAAGTIWKLMLAKIRKHGKTKAPNSDTLNSLNSAGTGSTRSQLVVSNKSTVSITEKLGLTIVTERMSLNDVNVGIVDSVNRVIVRTFPLRRCINASQLRKVEEDDDVIKAHHLRYDCLIEHLSTPKFREWYTPNKTRLLDPVAMQPIEDDDDLITLVNSHVTARKLGTILIQFCEANERALARRTIYFTKDQTYFECGNGIRCETLASMHNTMADFIGDPRFPEKAMKANNRALQIAYYQDLYKLYSRLEFSRDADRPIAIAGLEKRLRQAFGTKGGFGIFDDSDKYERGLFHRSLLWRHGDEPEFENGLEPIDFSRRGYHVPSWSWMAYKGGIDYATPEGGTAEWELNDIKEPWTRGAGPTTDSGPQNGVIAIQATVRNFQVANRLPDEFKLFYDTGRTKGSDGQCAQCVVVARDKRGRSEGLKRHYVLLVVEKKAEDDHGRKIYERIGAGFMLGKHIVLGVPGIKAEIW